jgi:arylsulfatase A-like enzyme
VGLAAAVLWHVSSDRKTGVRIVLITLDTLRADAFFDDDGSSRMPLTKGRSQGCACFPEFYASTSTTQPSHASMFTGLHPWTHGVTRNLVPLLDEYETIAETLQGEGFLTAAVVASHVVARHSGLAQGFSYYRQDFDRVVVNSGGDASTDTEANYSLADTVTDSALELLDRHGAAERQFYWFHYFDAHEPYGDAVLEQGVRIVKVKTAILRGADRSSELARARGLYDQDVAYLDGSLDRLLERLDRDSEKIATHVVIVSDHGESFGEDGSIGHGRQVTQWQVQAPLILCSSRVEPGIRRDVAGSIDVYSTIRSLAGLPHAIDRGRDLTRRDGETAVAMGMRRTFAKPYSERRIDGSVHVLDFNEFFFVTTDGLLLRGNENGLFDTSGVLNTDAQRSDVKAAIGLFRNLELQLRDNEGEALEDPENVRRLRALGYTE